MRMIADKWRRGNAYRDRIGAYALIVGRDGMLLLVDEEGELQLPGGGIDPGESPLQALHREVIEETGWRIAEPRRIGGFQRFAYLESVGYWGHVVKLVYAARAVRRLGPPTEGWHQPLWMAPEDAARKLDLEGDRVMVANAISAGLV